MHVIANWAHIDGDLSVILTTMLGADVHIGAAMYQALSSAEAKRAALLAAAKEALPDWKYIILQAALKATKPSRDQRNDFAHHVWGTAPELPDAILLMHPNVVLQVNVSCRQIQNQSGNRVITPQNLNYSKIMVYKEADFAKAVRESNKVYLIYGYLWQTIYGAPEIGRRWPLSEPLIQPIVANLSRESDQLTQDILRPPIGDEPPPKGTHG